LALLAAQRALGRLDTTANRLEAARTRVQASLDLARSCAVPYEEALTLFSLAELCVAERKRDDALALLDEAAAILNTLEARPALQQIAALRAALGARVTPSRYPAGLSVREVEVLRLVAEGLSSAEVAGRLVLSPRTVEQHLRSIYNKLGVSSRAAATRFAVEHGLDR
jgi:DNA-binding CsgD family transcriptional regulator